METLLLFAKAPVAGTIKTPLAAERGEAAALALATGFLLDIADTCGQWRVQQLGADLNRRVVLYVHGAIDHPAVVEAARRAGARIEEQQGEQEGERLKNAFEAESERGARAVCAIGADAPSVPAHLLDDAFRALLWERVVLGPTFDLGCWLMGAQRPAPDLFTNDPWSSPQLLMRTVERLRAAVVEPHLLPFWYDVDGAAGLARLVWHVRSVRAQHSEALAATWRVLGDLGLRSSEHRP